MSGLMSEKEKRQYSEHCSETLMPAVHLYKNIRVILTNHKVYIGWLKCIDPISGTLILITLKSMNDTFEMTEVIFIQASFIATIEVLTEVDPAVKSFLIKLYAPEVAVDEDRRDRLVAFIKSTKIPAEVSEDGKLITLLGCAIHPPYTAESVMSSNRNIVRGIGKAIKCFDERSKAIEVEETEANEESDFAYPLNSGDVLLGSKMQYMSRIRKQRYSPTQDTGLEKDLTDLDLSSDEPSNNESSFEKNQSSSLSGESSATEESFELVM